MPLDEAWQFEPPVLDNFPAGRGVFQENKCRGFTGSVFGRPFAIAALLARELPASVLTKPLKRLVPALRRFSVHFVADFRVKVASLFVLPFALEPSDFRVGFRDVALPGGLAGLPQPFWRSLSAGGSSRSC